MIGEDDYLSLIRTRIGGTISIAQRREGGFSRGRVLRWIVRDIVDCGALRKTRNITVRIYSFAAMCYKSLTEINLTARCDNGYAAACVQGSA